MKFRELALLTVEERSDYIKTAAAESGLSELIIEKDFWVVWLLEQLFALSPTLGPFTFKGGTSLSKGFNAIQRFSEDIDISIGRATLGFPDDEYFYESPSAKETKRRVEQIRDVVKQYAVESLLPALRDHLAGKIQGTWSLEAGDPGSLRFQYTHKRLVQSDPPSSKLRSSVVPCDSSFRVSFERRDMARKSQGSPLDKSPSIPELENC